MGPGCSGHVYRMGTYVFGCTLVQKKPFWALRTFDLHRKHGLPHCVGTLLSSKSLQIAAAKDLDRFMYLGPMVSVHGMGTHVFGCRGPEHGERI